MHRAIVSDTSCLIILTKIGELEILSQLYGSVMITPEIASEYGEVLPNWIDVHQVKDDLRLRLLEMHLDTGEASAIALALETANSVVIIDDWKGRKVAERLGVLVTGTLGVIIKSKKRGIIPSIKPYLAKIKETNFRLSDALESIALKEAGEESGF